jgi:hypothetical protein
LGGKAATAPWLATERSQTIANANKDLAAVFEFAPLPRTDCSLTLFSQYHFAVSDDVQHKLLMPVIALSYVFKAFGNRFHLRLGTGQDPKRRHFRKRRASVGCANTPNDRIH